MPPARLRKATTMEVDDLSTAMAICSIEPGHLAGMATAAEPIDFESDSDDDSYVPDSRDSEEDSSLEEDEGDEEYRDGDDYDDLMEDDCKLLLQESQNMNTASYHIDDDDDDDNVSEYCPSDTEEEIRPCPKPWKIRAHNAVAQLSQLYNLPPTTPLTHWIARMRKYNRHEHRWMDKGPVVLYIPPGRPDWLCANYLYGMKSIALNMKIPEHWARYQSFSGKYALFSTCGHNGIFRSTWKYHLVPITSLIPNQLLERFADAEPDRHMVMHYVHKVVPVQQRTPTTVLLRFVDVSGSKSGEDVCADFQRRMHENVEWVRRMAFEERYNSFTLPQNVWGVERVSIYGACAEFVEKLALTGLKWNPVEALEQTTCTFCSATLAFDNPSIDPVIAHKQHKDAMRCRCPFVYAPGEIPAPTLPVYTLR
ncbi:uncharacterized protein SPPG_06840 [Spizellomyces punctatus DAOM BR117]|uniref:Uncharacterized protein n=1 Tax=Spizellomyces punctatus (strain DAOM BR117) TaxID=645134 RepID=A0A0L0HAB0_SPIPD|nr:uncharacterized protein SPPG_06840 [Spizellomyces punctatus DAOM BR117]KNC97844.1 hypothetical protein SPPG_06840 [Spizellomyces punctatus DAOM BR117]|eukprot:XP_016605884.1 hypothetical protein SPPG_06840 [Spizellomyces punctatus DAOM BR117]